MSKILAINAGSSSLKFQLIEMPEEEVITKGLVERIGLNDGVFTISVNGEKNKKVQDIPNHEVAVHLLLDQLISTGIIKSFNEIDGVGHRVLHGGEIFSDSAIITDEVLAEIEKLVDLGPLHMPPNISGIKVFRKILPNVPQVAVFDTAFHQTMPKSSYLYSLPYEYYEKYGIRKYGFHGTSHKYVTLKAAEMLGKPIEELRLISCHLGNGASIAAVHGGKSIDTSMGFTPLEGITMGTRSGSIDPALIPFIMKKTGQSAEEVINVLNKKSGLLGITGFSSDLRDIEEAANVGNERAELALTIFANHIHKYIGSYVARMNGVDAIIFTAGIGENSAAVRERVLRGLEFMGVYWDKDLNREGGGERFISYPFSPVKVLVIPTNEEVMIARDVIRLAKKLNNLSK
ncbi:acetate kinase [Caldifermentibacillus hisashii]|jgi:acetate kinase|uniref:Acetate kinase n=1 Tax=Caldibacillus thermoamylovorans TaxID=35841 RepID=A0A090J0Y2_9BACI|nr:MULTISPECIES: acetate kinase [Bacillaceae]MCB5933373.1 acetate kinase [Bacillus sp. DFI.2.34]KIO69240.1 Acetate kinase [Caldibacillus thermoamylovorans]KIO70037.1 Acetate kinase [Caldibacillus thermoamylovorans]MCB7077394.1 acetate kinase [Caldibacillus thermoamylovorans]MCM3054206.1 acetate kinase [Caldibacillus thermoamylovorans]